MRLLVGPAVALAVLSGVAARADEPQHDLRPQAVHADVALPDGSQLRVDTTADDLRTFLSAGVVTLVRRDGSVDVAAVTCTAALHRRMGAVTREPSAVVADATGATDAVFSAFSAATSTTYYGFLGNRMVRGVRTPYASLMTQPDYGRCGSPQTGRPVVGTVTITA